MHDPPLRLLATFHEIYPALEPTYIIQAPGRELWVAAAVSEAEAFTIHAPDLEGRVSFSWRTAKNKRTLLNRPLPSWARYPAGVILRLCADGLDADGVEAVVLGAERLGPRYDYSLGIAFAALLHTLHDQPYTADSLLDVVEKVRREYVET